eukprot:UN03766
MPSGGLVESGISQPPPPMNVPTDDFTPKATSPFDKTNSTVKSDPTFDNQLSSKKTQSYLSSSKCENKSSRSQKREHKTSMQSSYLGEPPFSQIRSVPKTTPASKEVIHHNQSLVESNNH